MKLKKVSRKKIKNKPKTMKKVVRSHTTNHPIPVKYGGIGMFGIDIAVEDFMGKPVYSKEKTNE